MADEALKPRSFRITDDVLKRFQEISQDIGGNQQQTLAKLIEAFEFQKGKTILTEKKADIELFERYVSAITRMFMGSLEDNQNITATIRTEFERQLDSKEKIIIDLQNKIELLKMERNEAVQIKGSLEETVAMFNKRIENEYEPKLKDLSDEIGKRDKQASILSDSYNELKRRAESVKELQEENKALLEQNKKLNNELLEQKQMSLELKENYLKQIEEYQQKYKAALEQLETKQAKTTRTRKTTGKPDAETPDKKESK